MSSIKLLSKKAGFVLAVAAAAVVGGATTALVTAAIPSATDGQIHGCYRNSGNVLNPTGSLRVIDTDASQTCTGQETNIDWGVDKTLASGGVKGDGTLDTAHLKNILSYTDADTSVSSIPGYCLDLPFDPGVVVASQPGSVVLKGIEPEEFEQHCASQYDAFVASSNGRIDFLIR